MTDTAQAQEGATMGERAQTFEQLAQGCNADERDALAFHLACMRLRRTYESLRREGGRRCFTYCGASCDCGARLDTPDHD